MPKIKRALLSVYDKTRIVELAKGLLEYEVEIISTGGTAKKLNENGIKSRAISDVTGFPEILKGRLKTLHPNILGGMLAQREDSAQMEETGLFGIDLIDLVIVNLYPFERTIAKKDVTLLEALENIDIGGHTMIRAAAKNFLSVAVVTSPSQYDEILDEIKNNQGEVSIDLRKELAAEAFSRTYKYDVAINHYLTNNLNQESTFPERVILNFEKVQDLRYGENPHQHAALYREVGHDVGGLSKAKQIHGKELSYNNIIDLEAALGVVREFEEPCAVVIKHTNPCGVAIAKTLSEAYLNARSTDPQSAFGGIVGLNRIVDSETAQAVVELFAEAIISPGFEPEALKILQLKKNLRLIESEVMDITNTPDWDFKRVQGGVLLQDPDFFKINEIKFRVVTNRSPSEDEWAALKFGWKIAKWVKSNAIVYSTRDRTIGIGAGQMSRVDSSMLAVEKAKRMGHSLQGTAVASDAFFPFRDGVDAAAEAGATAIIQPGGSIRDEEVIQSADEHKMTMVFTNVRHFRH